MKVYTKWMIGMAAYGCLCRAAFLVGTHWVAAPRIVPGIVDTDPSTGESDRVNITGYISPNDGEPILIKGFQITPKNIKIYMKNSGHTNRYKVMACWKQKDVNDVVIGKNCANAEEDPVDAEDLTDALADFTFDERTVRLELFSVSSPKGTD